MQLKIKEKTNKALQGDEKQLDIASSQKESSTDSFLKKKVLKKLLMKEHMKYEI